MFSTHLKKRFLLCKTNSLSKDSVHITREYIGLVLLSPRRKLAYIMLVFDIIIIIIIIIYALICYQKLVVKFHI